MLMPVRFAEPTLPARSVARPVADRFVTSVAISIGAVRLPGTNPDSASVAAKVTATGPLFHPSALGSGDEMAVTAGAVLSRFTVTLAVAVLPDLSVAVPSITWPAPSMLTTRRAGQVAIPEPSSAHTNFTVTLVRFQPVALGAGVATAVMAGGVVSLTISTVSDV